MPATFTPELKHPARKDGTHAVRIRITHKRKHAYWNIGKNIMPSDWNPTPSLKLHNYVIRHENAKQINNAIKNKLSELGAIADKNPGLSAAGIKEAYERSITPEEETQAAPVSFFAAADEVVSRVKETNLSTGQNYGYFLSEFKAIAGEHTPYPELFSERTAHRYLKALKAGKNAPSTIKKKIETLKNIYKAVTRSGSLPPLPVFALASLKVTVPRKKKERPTAEQIRQFLNYKPTTEARARAYTVGKLQYLLQGARITEALTLEWANVQESYVEYLPQKGAKKPKFIPRSKMLNQLLESMGRTGPLVLPYLGTDYPRLTPAKQIYRRKRIITEVNAALTEIAEELKFNLDLTSHMFRHAFADAIIATGSSVHVAAALLGHANAATTENYIKDLGLSDVSELALSIFDKLGEQ